MGSHVINLLRRGERKARLRFWKALMLVSTAETTDCPFTGPIPAEAIEFGTMPTYLRAAFIKTHQLRTAERKGEAEVFEEAMSELLQEHFRKELALRQKHLESPIGHFRIGTDWKVYGTPIR